MATETKTARDAAIDILRDRGMTTIFGNPGSTELYFLSDFPDDFTYVLGLQESAALAMADGYAQASGKPTLVNLHTAAGVGHAMGSLYNAWVHKAPLVLLAGQQARSLLTVGGHLMSREATRLPQPYVKWAYEPPRPEDVPHALARAINLAGMAPMGPTFVSVPMFDWLTEVDAGAHAHYRNRPIIDRRPAAPAVVAEIARRLDTARRPLLVAGPDIDVTGGWDAAVRLAERGRLAVMASPASGGGRLGFPENHPLFQGILPLGIDAVGRALQGYDFVLVVGSSVFPYYIDMPGELLPAGTTLVQVTSDPDEAARAPMGEAIVADVALTLEALVAQMEPAPGREAPPVRPERPAAEAGRPLSTSAALQALKSVLTDDTILVSEAASSALIARDLIRRSRPGTYFYIAGGGLGWGLPSAIGVALARPDQPVVCLLGDGSAHYTIQGLWTAATYRVPITYVVLRNDSYSILKYLSKSFSTSGVPGLELPGLETAEVARAYGLDVVQVDDDEQLRAELGRRVGSGMTSLIEVVIGKEDDPSY